VENDINGVILAIEFDLNGEKIKPSAPATRIRSGTRPPKWGMKIVYVSLSHLGEERYFFSSGHVSWNSISSEEALRSCSMLMIAAAGMEIRSPAT